MSIKMNVKGNPDLFRCVVVRAESMGYKFYKGANYVNLACDFIYFYDDMDLAFGVGEQYYKNHSAKEVNPIHWLNSEFFDHPKIKGFDWENHPNVRAITTGHRMGIWFHGSEDLTPGILCWSNKTGTTNVPDIFLLTLSNVNWKECILRRSQVTKAELKDSIGEDEGDVCGWENAKQKNTVRVQKQLFTDLGKPLILPHKIEHKIDPLVFPEYVPDYQDILNFKED